MTSMIIRFAARNSLGKFFSLEENLYIGYKILYMLIGNEFFVLENKLRCCAQVYSQKKCQLIAINWNYIGMTSLNEIELTKHIQDT